MEKLSLTISKTQKRAKRCRGQLFWHLIIRDAVWGCIQRGQRRRKGSVWQPGAFALWQAHKNCHIAHSGGPQTMTAAHEWFRLATDGGVLSCSYKFTINKIPLYRQASGTCPCRQIKTHWESEKKPVRWAG